MKHHICLFLAISTGLTAMAQVKDQELYKSRDLTKEQMFSVNIEGPNYDRQSGYLYVVNFQKDGTIGKINTKNGRAIRVVRQDVRIAWFFVFSTISENTCPTAKNR